jgi:hypothetical protein
MNILIRKRKATKQFNKGAKGMYPGLRASCGKASQDRASHPLIASVRQANDQRECVKRIKLIVFSGLI